MEYVQSTQNSDQCICTCSVHSVYVCVCVGMYIYTGGSVVNNLSVMQETWVQPLDREDALEKGLATPVFLPGESHRQRNLAGYGLWGYKEWDTTKRLNVCVCVCV